MHRPGRDRPLQPFFDLTHDRATVGLVVQSHDREKHGLFETAKDVSHLCLHCRSWIRWSHCTMSKARALASRPIARS